MAEGVDWHIGEPAVLNWRGYITCLNCGERRIPALIAYDKPMDAAEKARLLARKMKTCHRCGARKTVTRGLPVNYLLVWEDEYLDVYNGS